MLEADGGEALVRWFDGLQEEFSIEVEMVVHTTKENPFGWIITYPPVLQLPATYPRGRHSDRLHRLVQVERQWRKGLGR